MKELDAERAGTVLYWLTFGGFRVSVPKSLTQLMLGSHMRGFSLLSACILKVPCP